MVYKLCSLSPLSSDGNGLMVRDADSVNLESEYTMRIFKHNGEVFCGFDTNVTLPHRLVLCQDEDVLSTWAIDGLNIQSEIDELLRYFRTTQSQEKLIGIYKEDGFRGCKIPQLIEISRLSRYK